MSKLILFNAKLQIKSNKIEVNGSTQTDLKWIKDSRHISFIFHESYWIGLNQIHQVRSKIDGHKTKTLKFKHYIVQI